MEPQGHTLARTKELPTQATCPVSHPNLKANPNAMNTCAPGPKFTHMHRHSDNQKTVYKESKVVTLLHFFHQGLCPNFITDVTKLQSLGST
jgi:hypothetical protein